MPGIFPRVSILDVTPETWRAVLGVNLMGTVFCSQALARDMVKRGRGVVVNIASGRALQGTPRGAHYAASKAGIVSFTKSLRWNSPSRACGPTASSRASPKPRSRSPIPRSKSCTSAASVSRSGASRQPEDIARVVAFLFSDDAAYMTGQSVPVNGGAIMIPLRDVCARAGRRYRRVSRSKGRWP